MTGSARRGADDDVLAYADQAAFLALRALGRAPIIQITWVHDQPIEDHSVRAFNDALSRGFLARLILPSRLPWGRHRWVANEVPPPITYAPQPIPPAEVPRWRRALAGLSVDPERGPGWRLVVQPLDGGGVALSLLVSHVVADGLAVCQAVVDAARGILAASPYRPPSRGPLWHDLTRDLWLSIRGVPEVATALAWLAFREGSRIRNMASPVVPRQPRSGDESDGRGDAPEVLIVLEEQACLDAADRAGTTMNALFAMLAARLAFHQGRLAPDGRVNLVLPISDRVAGDRRGNALRAVKVAVDPATCCARPGEVRRDIRAAIQSVSSRGDDVAPLLPLAPYVPARLVPGLEAQALGAGLPVGCSILGQLDPAFARPCGIDASRLHISLVEHQTAAGLNRQGGKLFLACYRVAGTVGITVSAWATGRVETREALAVIAVQALNDLSLPGNVL